MAGQSVPTIGNAFTISSDISGSSKLCMYPNGPVQLGYNDLSNLNNNRLIIGDIFSGFISFVSNVGSIFRNVANGTTYGATSDYRLKSNIKPVENAVEKVMKLNPVNFNFIGNEHSINGFLAHEMQEIEPSGVKGYKDEVDAEGKPVYQQADYKALVPVLTASIQELVKRIEYLEKLIC